MILKINTSYLDALAREVFITDQRPKRHPEWFIDSTGNWYDENGKFIVAPTRRDTTEPEFPSDQYSTRDNHPRNLKVKGTKKPDMKNITKSPLKAQMLEAGLGLTEQDFGHHATDLYVVAQPGVYEWLKKNYEFFKSIRGFTGNPEATDWNGAGRLCYDIPFAGDWPS